MLTKWNLRGKALFPLRVIAAVTLPRTVYQESEISSFHSCYRNCRSFIFRAQFILVRESAARSSPIPFHTLLSSKRMSQKKRNKRRGQRADTDYRLRWPTRSFPARFARTLSPTHCYFLLTLLHDSTQATVIIEFIVVAWSSNERTTSSLNDKNCRHGANKDLDLSLIHI